jgi:hypothetical protein
MDTYVLASGEVAPVLGAGNRIGTTADERFTIRVSEEDLWLWAGTFNPEEDITLPVDYTLTICPRNISLSGPYRGPPAGPAALFTS